MAHVVFLALANMLDHFPGSAFSYKPSGIVCYSPGIVAEITWNICANVLMVFVLGIYGGMRAAIQLRAMLAEIGCISVSNIFGIPQVNKALDESGQPMNDHMVKYVYCTCVRSLQILLLISKITFPAEEQPPCSHNSTGWQKRCATTARRTELHKRLTRTCKRQSHNTSSKGYSKQNKPCLNQ